MTTSSKPNLRKIAEDWDEEYYRSRPELSYSQLSKYAREGFNGYLTLNEHIETPSLTFGSALDCLLTEGKDSFKKKYYASTSVLPDSKSKMVIDCLIKMTPKDIVDIRSVPISYWEKALDSVDFYSNLKLDTRIGKFKNNGSIEPKYYDYFKLIKESGDKTPLDTDTYSRVKECERSILCNRIISKWFTPDLFGEVEIFHQLKFKATFGKVSYRCMADAILVDHNKKLILPLDLKTTSKQVYDFYKSFIEWRYDIQARLYWRIINSCAKHSPEFKDYTVGNYVFAVVNSYDANSMAWVFPETKVEGELIYGKNNNIILQDPFTIGEELKSLIDSCATHPLGTSYDNYNNLTNFLKRM